MVRALLVVMLSVLATACRGETPRVDDPDGTTDADVDSTDTETQSTTSDETSAQSDEGDTEDTGLFVADVCSAADPSLCDECGTVCNPFEQNCPEGEKCTAVSCDPGNGAWDSNVCRPVLGDGLIGEPCSVAENQDGLDDCAAGLLCWDENPDTGLGYCVEFCEGSPTAASCPEGHTCPIYSTTVLSICIPLCDPLAPDCPNPHNLCIPTADHDGFACASDASGGQGPYGTPCSIGNACNPGLVCIAAESVPAPTCTGADACCSPICDITQPNTCPGAAEGQQCVPWFQAPEIPEGYEDVGVCAIPAAP